MQLEFREKEYRYLERSVPEELAALDASVQLEFEGFELLAAELADELGDIETAQFIRDRYHAREGQIHPDIDVSLMYFEAFPSEPFPVSANENWADGLIMAADQFFAHHAAEVLDEIHEEYVYLKSHDLVEKAQRNYYWKIAEQYADGILEERAEQGEPKDFNF